MNSNAPQSSIDRVVSEIERMGSTAHLSRGQFRTVIGAVGEEGQLDQNHLASLDGVEKVVPIMKPYKLASREFHDEDSVVVVGGGRSALGGDVPKVLVGGPHAACIAGPCAVENEQMLNKIARHGGARRPRGSPGARPGGPLPAGARSRTSRCQKSPPATSATAARPSSAAAPSSPAPAPTPSRATAKPPSNGCAPAATNWACP